MQALRLEIPIGIPVVDLDLDFWVEEAERARRGDEVLEREERERLARSIRVELSPEI